jgi:hypothetical protein
MHALGITHAKMSGTQHCNTSFVRVVSATLLGALIVLCLNRAVPAAGTCIEGPSLKAGQGGHWYYRVDRVNNRKCWYMADTQVKTQEGAPSEPTPSPTSTPNSTLSSWFTSLGAGPPASAVAQPSAIRETRVPHTAPSKTLKIVHAIPKERPHPARRPETKGIATAERNQQSPSSSSAEHTEQVTSQPPDQAAQDALFLEFLRWKELQKSVK